MPMIDSESFKAQLDAFEDAKQAYMRAVDELPGSRNQIDPAEHERLYQAVGNAREVMHSMASRLASVITEQVNAANAKSEDTLRVTN